MEDDQPVKLLEASSSSPIIRVHGTRNLELTTSPVACIFRYHLFCQASWFLPIILFQGGKVPTKLAWINLSLCWIYQSISGKKCLWPMRKIHPQFSGKLTLRARIWRNADKLLIESTARRIIDTQSLEGPCMQTTWWISEFTEGPKTWFLGEPWGFGEI